MKILQINLYDKEGGSAKIANAITKEVQKIGHEVNCFAMHCVKEKEANVWQMKNLQSDFWHNLMLKKRREGLADLYGTALLDVFQSKYFFEADIVHLHCINGGYFSYFLLPFLASKKLIWTFHDTLVRTASCLYPQNCNGWQTGYCFNCPMDLKGTNNIKRANLQKMKQALFNMCNLQIVVPSKWMEYLVKEDNFFGKTKAKLIYNGIDINVYRPLIETKKELRAALKLPQNKKIIMLAAHGGLNAPWKGGKFTVEVLKRLGHKMQDCVFLHIGSQQKNVLQDLPLEVINLPFIKDNNLLVNYYNAADVFLTTSLTESFGLTVCEAMACGMPVVGFASGGIPEIVDHAENGFLVEQENVEKLTEYLFKLLNEDNLRFAFSKSARKKIEKCFSEQKMVQEYLMLYEQNR